MFEELKIEVDKINKMYRGLIPFFLKGISNHGKIYISSSNKNLEDYYFVLKDIYQGKLLRIEGLNSGKEEFNGKKEKLVELINQNEDFIALMSLDSALENYSEKITKKELKVNDKYSIKDIIFFLEEEGYSRNYTVEKRGQYSVRGDIFDIYSVENDFPVRIEFFGNDIESIRYFDIETQRSINKLETIEIYSNKPQNETKNITEIINENAILLIENNEVVNYRIEEYILLNRDREVEIRETYSKLISDAKQIEIKGFSIDESDRYKNYEEVKSIAENQEITIFSEEDSRYKEIFSDIKNIKIYKYPYFEGFEYEKQLFLTDRELKGIKIRRGEKRKEGIKLSNISLLKNGDYIIHKNYGVGIYHGLTDIGGKEYIAVKYAGEDKLYVPVDHINWVQKYVNAPDKIPEIFNLGRKGFKRRREKLQIEIEKFAKELIKIQAKRNLQNGYKFSTDTVWQEEFEEIFPFNETKGQLKAIDEVKSDMESHKAMDRVICGDVGFGKTEVALRAAFKSASEGKQVAFMAPTTVLATQHYERIVERFKNFPITIEVISRVQTAKEQKKILEELKRGVIDIIVGTHRLIQEDIIFKDLGLVIIDEEQKFGVKAKEKLKNYRNNIDILTLTATPIPRTLNLALLGIRDISIIETPPENKLPVETFFCEYSMEKIKEAILKEIARDGQVFYLYNSVENIKTKMEEIKKILPEYVKVNFVHGQMEAQEVKNRMDEFKNRHYDVMITTTIIENGIDMDNVNTMIIDEYDKLGLSQIYQLRGRVGRGNRKSYCYLLHREHRITAKGKERIETLKNMKDLGAGFELSLEDMRIRGAGDILGEKQSGALEEFGYDMYIKMLNDELKKINGEPTEESKNDIKMDISLRGFIPSSYIEESEKVVIYRRIVLLNDLDKLKELYNELCDRFGKMPDEAKKLFTFMKIKIKAIRKNVIEIKEEEKGYLVKIDSNNIEINTINMLLSNKIAKYRQKDSALYIEGEIRSLDKFLDMI